MACNHIQGEKLPTELPWDAPVEPITALRLDPSPMKAMQKMQRIEAIQKRLYGLDCGSCGAPSCRALAEDIVNGYADEDACIYILKKKVERQKQARILNQMKLLLLLLLLPILVKVMRNFLRRT